MIWDLKIHMTFIFIVLETSTTTRFPAEYANDFVSLTHGSK